MTSGDCMALVLGRFHIKTHWRQAVECWLGNDFNKIKSGLMASNTGGSWLDQKGFQNYWERLIVHIRNQFLSRVSEARKTAPKSIRAQFGDPDDDSRFHCNFFQELWRFFRYWKLFFSDSNSFFTDWKLGRNAVHGSDSYEAAGREIDLLFPTITGIVVLYLINNISLFIGDADGINFGSGLEDAVKEVGEEQKTYLARWQKYKEG